MVVVDARLRGVGAFHHVDVPYVLVAAVAVAVGPLGVVAHACELVCHGAAQERRLVHLAALPVEHLVAHAAVHEYGERPALVGERVVPAEGVLGQAAAEEVAVVGVDDAVAVEVLEEQVADGSLQGRGRGVAHHRAHAVVGRGGDYGARAVAVVSQEVGRRVDAAGHAVAVILAHAVAHGRAGYRFAAPCLEVERLVDEARLAVKRGYLVLVERVGQPGLPLEVLFVYHRGVERKLNALVAHRAYVGPLCRRAACDVRSGVPWQGRLQQKVLRVLAVCVEDELNAVVPKAQVEADVPRVGLLPGKSVVVGHVGREVARAEVGYHVGERRLVSVVGKVGVSHQTVAHAELERVDGLQERGEERLFGYAPCQCGRGESAPALAARKARAAVVAHGGREQVAVEPVIGKSAEEADEAFCRSPSVVGVLRSVAAYECQVVVASAQTLAVKIVTVAVVHLVAEHERELVRLDFPVAGGDRLERHVLVVGLRCLVGGIVAARSAEVVCRQQVTVVVGVYVVSHLVAPAEPFPGLQRKVEIRARGALLVVARRYGGDGHGVGRPRVGLAVVSGLAPRSVLVLDGNVGQHAERVAHNSPRSHARVLVGVRDVDRRAEVEPLVSLDVQGRAEGETFEAVVDDDAVLGVVSARNAVVDVLRAAAHGEVVLLLHARAEHRVLPVGALAEHVGVGKVALARLRYAEVGDVGAHLAQVHHVELLGQVAEARRGLQADARRAFLALLHVHDDNAVGGLRSVDGGCRCVFQNLDALYVVGIKPVERVRVRVLPRLAAYYRAVDDVHRLVGRVQGVDSAYLYARARASRAAVAGHRQSGGSPLEHLVHRGRARLLKVFGLDRHN